jgi:hypothetical protein
MSEENKTVDESWKEEAEKEKLAHRKEQEEIKEDIPEVNFSFFLTTLGLQAAIFLGEIPNPVSNKKEENLPQAKFIIDTLDMLKEKTKGNLSTEEDSLLDNMLYDLRMRYVSRIEKGKE